MESKKETPKRAENPSCVKRLFKKGYMAVVVVVVVVVVVWVLRG